MPPSPPDSQKGSARVVTLMSIVALSMALLGAWWGLVVVPGNKAAEALQTRAWIDSLVASRSFLDSAGSKLRCDALGGDWRIGQDTVSASSITHTPPGQTTPTTVAKRQRIRTPDYCSMPATDGGKACLSSSECESFCVGRMVLGERFAAQCHPYRNAAPDSFGSIIVVEQGRPLFRLSIAPVSRSTSESYVVLAGKIEVQMIDGSKLKVGDKVRATQELRDKPWFPSFGIPGT
jgi:hypothetical protein